jgi:hypothetical protein
MINIKSNSFMKYSIKASSIAKVRRYTLRNPKLFGITPKQPIVLQIQQNYFRFFALVLLKCGTFSIMMNFDYSGNNSERNKTKETTTNG